jgi:hypothetical protein
MPRPLFERPKQGFSVPSQWFEAPLRALASDLLTTEALKGQDYLDPKAVEHLCRQQRAGWEKLDPLVLHLSIFQAWRVAQQPSKSTASRTPPVRALATTA